MKKVNFIKKIVEHEKKFEHVGMTHDLLSIPRDFNLADVKQLLRKIVKTPIDDIIDNPTKIGKKQYKVTKELKQHVNAALNLINISQNFNKKK
jgi:hypothetical protein